MHVVSLGVWVCARASPTVGAQNLTWYVLISGFCWGLLCSDYMAGASSRVLLHLAGVCPHSGSYTGAACPSESRVLPGLK